ncbi:MAG TPA: maleylpyruvate isomerase N-terminal domain-containing protein [Chloroflexota bacterium]|nr:maleylpyruvate isomerase N-terminal domain-containing protein [Chloroflexota bacterium]
MQRTRSAPPLTPDDVQTAAAVCRAALTPALGRDWETRAGTLEWSCRRTVDHIVDAQSAYAAHLARRARERLPRVRSGNPELAPAELLAAVEIAAAILADVVRAAPPDARGWHPAGLADGEGFVGMACTEILVHTADVAEGLEQPFTAPADLAARVVARLFPWAPADGDAWATLRWACGRAALGDRAQLAPDWYWQCAPLAEWDGTIRKRTMPPGWR